MHPIASNNATKPVVGVYEREPGSGLWCGRYRAADSKLVRKSFGKDRQAVEWVEKARTIRCTGEGVLPATAKRHPRTNEELARMGGSDIILAELCNDFERYVLTHPDEYRDQKNPPRRRQEIRKAFGERPASGIRTEEIADWLDAVQEDRELANATVNKLRGTFSKIYRHGKRRGKVAVNPAGEAELRPVSEGIERFLSIEEEKRLRAVLEADIGAHVNHPELRKQAILRMLELDVSLRSGMRKSEQFNLRWSDVDFDRRIMRLRKTKNGKPRNAFIIEDVAVALRTLKELDLSRRGRTSEQKSTAPADSVFAKGDNKKWWIPALKKARITQYRWHDNRHTFCSRLGAGRRTPQGRARGGWPQEHCLDYAVYTLCSVADCGRDGRSQLAKGGTDSRLTVAVSHEPPLDALQIAKIILMAW